MAPNRSALARSPLQKMMMRGSFAIPLLLWAATAFATDKPKFSLGTIPEPKRETFLMALEKSWAAGNSDRLRDLWGYALRVTPGGMDRFPEGATPSGILTEREGEL